MFMCLTVDVGVSRASPWKGALTSRGLTNSHRITITGSVPKALVSPLLPSKDLYVINSVSLCYGKLHSFVSYRENSIKVFFVDACGGV